MRNYERGLVFAAAVMVGAASENVVYLFANTLHRAIKDPAEQSTLQEVIERGRLPAILIPCPVILNALRN